MITLAFIDEFPVLDRADLPFLIFSLSRRGILSKKVASSGRKEKIMEEVGLTQSIRHKSQVLGIPHQTYRSRKKSQCPEQVDDQIPQLLNGI